MSTSDSLTKAIVVSSEKLHPGGPDMFNVGSKYQFKHSKQFSNTNFKCYQGHTIEVTCGLRILKVRFTQHNCEIDQLLKMKLSL